MSELGFYRFANSHPDEIAIVEPSEKIWTRGELLAKTNQLTHALREFGVKSGDVVATVLPNSVEYYICLLYTSPSPRDRTRSRMPSSA